MTSCYTATPISGLAQLKIALPKIHQNAVHQVLTATACSISQINNDNLVIHNSDQTGKTSIWRFLQLQEIPAMLPSRYEI
jgi:hypothetical protein